MTEEQDKNNEFKDCEAEIKKKIELVSSSMKIDDFQSLNEALCEIESIIDNFVDKITVLKILTNESFAQKLSEILYKLDNLDPTANESIYFPYYTCLSLCWDLSDSDFQFASEMVKVNIGQIMMRIVMQRLYLRRLNDKDSKEKYIINASLSTINNMTRFPGHRDLFDTVIFKDTLVFLSNNEDEFIQALACLCLANLINENESHLLENASIATQFLTKTVKSAKQSSCGRYRGFTALEMIQGLKAMSSNDLAKHKIVDAGCLELIESILGDSDKVDAEIFEITSILWNLTFDETLKQRIKNSAVITTALQSILTESSHSGIKKNIQGILNRCDATDSMMAKIDIAKTESEPPNPDLTPTPASNDSVDSAPAEEFKFHVFMSYCQRNADTVYPIVDELKKNNIKVWLDKDQIDGSTLESMADGIDDSKIILIGMSEAYKDSPNCRTEAEYAHYLKKPIIPLIMAQNYKPKGWLGMMLGTKLYYDFGGGKPFEIMSANLIGALKKKL